MKPKPQEQAHAEPARAFPKISSKIEDWVVVAAPKAQKEEDNIDQFITDHFKLLGSKIE